MDKWDDTVDRIKNSILAEEPEAVLAGSLQMVADVGRTLELISQDMDRFATAAEGLLEVAKKTAVADKQD